jgi:hypothetical protein
VIHKLVWLLLVVAAQAPLYPWCMMHLDCLQCCYDTAVTECVETHPDCDCDDDDPGCWQYCYDVCIEEREFECGVESCLERL